ncbi:hypothetical protein [Sinorhizobium meliloti]|uniref:hypothetical protein n=1 Tax=Rhizobium meliloti TaxID=382 RepID=UPI000B4983BB|nr:hypothetical protein [Sinorhizobium meliloti]MDX0986031.1 hypothetical protein [Sinorhizobium medicae]ASQ15091.1 hypothetical protein CDO22_34935 [Sinorhizobium meliloti]MDW9378438.1 hypothetical protein [Sinorhizobium meliloti]MDW9496674.1 hypothetical protein [Sinorhizobium meliloti]MDW9546679.1 hypothetical protein [Sinorhizobium meliloti]
MTLVSGRLFFVIWFAVALAACSTQDRMPVGSVASSANDRGAPATPSSMATARSRTMAASQAKQQYFIEFRSRYAYTYGHSFVIFGRLDRTGKMIDPQVAGLAPKSNDPTIYMLGHVTPVPASTGWTDGDLEDKYMSANWRVMLSETEYRKVVAKIRKLQASSPLWHAVLYNCNAFVADIARFMGYKTPGIWLKPQQFITKLRQMNGGPNAIGRTRRAA